MSKMEITEQLTIDQLADHGISGIGNMGNTCFMNTTIQQLSHCPEFTRYFLTGEFKDDCKLLFLTGTFCLLSFVSPVCNNCKFNFIC